MAETGFDPAQVVDLYSSTLIAHVFDSPLQYDYLSRPARLVPGTTEALPEISADGRTIRFRLRPGIHFADDPAFGGRPRELVAQDYVYSIKRHFDPRWRSPSLTIFEDHLIGLRELRDEALKTSRSTMTARSRDCARSTATPSRCGCTAVMSAWSMRWPNAAPAARWPARWCRLTVSGSWRTR